MKSLTSVGFMMISVWLGASLESTTTGGSGLRIALAIAIVISVMLLTPNSLHMMP